MSTAAMHPLAVDYLRRLRRAGQELPAARLDDLCAELESHLLEAIPPGTSDAQARSVIERLGPPEEIVEAEQPASATGLVTEAPRRSWHETAAIILLLLGGFAFGVGWLAGLILLWTSRVWSLRDRLIGTLLVPGGLATVLPLLVLAGTTSGGACSGTATEVSPVFRPGRMHCATVAGAGTGHTVLAIVLLVIAIAGPIFTAIHLSRRAAAAGAAVAR